MRISDWSSDVCSSDLSPRAAVIAHHGPAHRFNAAADASVDHACSDLSGKQVDRIKTRRTEAMNLLASYCLRITRLEHRSAGKHATLLSHGLGPADDNVIQQRSVELVAITDRPQHKQEERRVGQECDGPVSDRGA